MITRKERLFEQIFRECAASCNATARWMGVEPTIHQKQIFDAVDTGAQWIAAASGQGIGKSAATCVVATHKALGVEKRGSETIYPRVILTAPTMHQCRENWLSEYDKILEKGHPALRRFIEVTRSRVYFGGKLKWGIEPRTASTPMAAQGIHNEKLYIIFDEASGIPRPMMEQFEGTLTNEGGGGLLIGNPNLRDCYFFDCFHGPLAKKFVKFTFDARDSPLVSKDTIKQHAEQYGEDSDFFRVRVAGLFPRQDPTSIMSLEDVQACTKGLKNRLVVSAHPSGYHFGIGIDFAFQGDAESVIAVREGNAITRIETFAHVDPRKVVDRAFAIQRMFGWPDKKTAYIVDAGGIGQGVIGLLHDKQKNTYEFHFGRKLQHRDYADEQTLAWFGVAKRVKEKTIWLPDDQRLHFQLSNRNYLPPDKTGKLRIEPKKDYIARGHESPDRADSVVMAMYDRISARGKSAGMDPSGVVGSSIR